MYIATAKLYEKSGNYSAATQHYEKALKVDPNDLAALRAYGQLLDRQNKLAEAAAMYERAAKAHPKSPAAHNDLGLCYARRGMMSEAAAELALAASLSPDKALYRNNLATVLVHEKRLDEALSHLKSAHPEATAYYNLGYLLQQQGQEELALAQFQRAAQIDPHFHEARNWSERLASRASIDRPATSRPQPRAQLASMSTPASTPSAAIAESAVVSPQATAPASPYLRAPEPGPPPNYLRSNDSESNSSSTIVGSRYAPSWDKAVSGRSDNAAATASDDRSTAEAGGNRAHERPGDADYRFLPPVNSLR